MFIVLKNKCFFKVILFLMKKYVDWKFFVSFCGGKCLLLNGCSIFIKEKVVLVFDFILLVFDFILMFCFCININLILVVL